MPSDEYLQSMPELPGLVDAWQAGGDAWNEATQSKLSELLQSSREARQYFLEMCQVDAELRWRYASQSEIDSALASHASQGKAQPIASIVLSGLGFREDPGFASVFDLVKRSEPHAQCWLQAYPVLRACLFLLQPTQSDAESIVTRIGAQLAGQPLTKLPVERFRQLVSDVTYQAVCQVVGTKPGSATRNLRTLIDRCVRLSDSIDVVALYESFEASIPHELPPGMLRILCLRYLLEMPPAEIAAATHQSATTVTSHLAEARLQIWRSCTSRTSLCEVPVELKGFSAANAALDLSGAFGSAPLAGSRRVGPERRAQEVSGWAASSDENLRGLIILAILHESLYRRLSLYQLLAESKTRRDEGFHRIVAEMVSHLENAAASVRPAVIRPRSSRRSRTTTAWLTTIAAAVFIAASVGIWRVSQPPRELPEAPILAERDPVPTPVPTVEPARELAPPIEIPQPVLVATVSKVLDAKLAINRKLEAGSPIYEGEQIDLAEGIVQLTTASGSEWVLEGPVQVVIVSGEEVSLVHGKIVGLNSGQGVPLVVQTPTARVLDLGTEFGVEVSNLEGTSVAVYDGSIELSAAGEGTLPTSATPITVEADYEATLDETTGLPAIPTRLAHDRAFIRPDEVELREESAQGSIDAAAKVAFYEMLRVDGLLAYQGFHGGSQAQELTVGFQWPRIIGPTHFAEDLTGPANAQPTSSSLVLSNSGLVFLDIDSSENSPIAKAGMLNAAGRVAPPGREIWVSWRSKSALPEGGRFNWSGLSLMNGDERRVNESIFVGHPVDTPNLGLDVVKGQDAAIRDLDNEPSLPGVQPLPNDNETHLWVVRVEFHDPGFGAVSMWCDVEPTELKSTAPSAEGEVEEPEFDRLRLEVSLEGDQGTCSFDEVYMTSSLEALIEAMARRQQVPASDGI
jgi:hypothetical protein